MTIEELRELLVLTVNRNTSTLSAEALDEAPNVVGVEVKESGELFFLEIQPA